MNTSVRDTLLEITSGDIALLDVDAVVVPTSEGLSMVGGAAGAVVRAGGQEIETLAVAQGPIQVGDALATTAGTLNAKWVVHVAMHRSGLTVDANLIAQATTRALQVADGVGVRSIGFPALGAGTGGFRVYSATAIVVGRVRAYLETTRTTGLRRVVFCAYDDAAKAAFGNALVGSARV
jgi:O-acetyl-ADP-ribose deacetylase